MLSLGQKPGDMKQGPGIQRLSGALGILTQKLFQILGFHIVVDRQVVRLFRHIASSFHTYMS